MKPIYIDNHLIVVRKTAGTLIQGDETGDPTLFEAVRSFIKQEFNKPGNVYLGMIHRLDRPVSGVVVFARTSKAASRLSAQFSQRKTKKIYWALVHGKMDNSGSLENYISRDGKLCKIGSKENGKIARLSWNLLKYQDGISWIQVELGTGRKHQIRLQLANAGHPIIGDFRYGSKTGFPKRSIALHARSLSITHPVKQEGMTFVAEPEDYWPPQFLE